MSTAVVTTFSPKGYEVYGKRMIESFVEHWPEDVRLYVFYEGAQPQKDTDRVRWFCLDDDMDRALFMRANADDNGVGPGDYRKRVVTYCHKVFAYTGAPRSTDWLIWLDGDTETHSKVTPDLLSHVQPQGMVASYLGRPWFRHSETGFLCFRLDQAGNKFLDDIKRMYLTQEYRKLPEWHDCMVFDHVRKTFERQGYRFKNLSEDGYGLDVFEQSILGKYMRHNKGPGGKQKAYGDSMLALEEA